MLFLQIGKAFPLFAQSKREPIAMDLHPIPPSPCATSQPGVRPRSRPSWLAMPCARRLPLLAAAPASPRALQTFCSCHLGRQLLGAAPWRRLHLRNWHPECRPAPPLALRTARCILAWVLAACPSAREHAMYSHANVAQPGGRPRSCFRERDLFCVVMCCHTSPHTAPLSCFVRSVHSWDACLQAACEPKRRFKKLYWYRLFILRDYMTRI